MRLGPLGVCCGLLIFCVGRRTENSHSQWFPLFRSFAGSGWLRCSALSPTYYKLISLHVLNPEGARTPPALHRPFPVTTHKGLTSLCIFEARSSCPGTRALKAKADLGNPPTYSWPFMARTTLGKAFVSLGTQAADPRRLAALARCPGLLRTRTARCLTQLRRPRAVGQQLDKGARSCR